MTSHPTLEFVQDFCRKELASSLEIRGKHITPLLYDAMLYALLAPGKRLRPFLVFLSGELFKLPFNRMKTIALSLEYVHCYSLIHDDLPCMDNAALRRGQATVHCQFNEATALMAGNVLLTLAFQMLAENPDLTFQERCELITRLSQASGGEGMMGGQQLDILGEKTAFDYEQIKAMQMLKTGALIQFALQSPAVVGGASEVQMQALQVYSEAFGFAYQIADDLLDYNGDENKTGKTAGLDAVRNKSTLINMLGVGGALAELDKQTNRAIHALEIFGVQGQPLQDLALDLKRRQC